MKRIINRLLLSAALVVFSFIVTASVFAIGKPQGTGEQNGQKQLGANSSASNIPISPGENGKLRSCQARENAIKTRMIHLIQLVNTMENKFDSIATRVENYYTDKVVPSGKTVSSYNTLVSDIQTQKNNVQTDLTKAQSDTNTFSCTSATSPKEQMTQFREDMQTVKKDLKDYRSAIKNLIVAVHSVTGAEESASPKPKK